LDTANAILHYKLAPGDENATLKWREDKIRVYDLALSTDKQRVAVVADQQKSIIIYNFPTQHKIASFNYEHVQLTSIRISQDCRSILVSMNPDLIREIDIETGGVIASYKWHTQSEFMIRSAFGGAGESFVCSGSEDSKIYIWRRNSRGERLQAITGHQKGCVNAISWNPVFPEMFASAGDDGSVRM
jgi:WD repeat-containing protein 26